MRSARRLCQAAVAGLVVSALAASPAAAQAVVAAAAAAPVPDKGDTTWVLVSSVLVLMMSVPGVALFYGGLVRAKIMLSVLMQVLTIVAIAALV